MTSPLREVPEYVWWCFTCNGGVGCWGQNVHNTPPPRCPDCHDNNFAPVKFVPAEPTKESVDE